MELRLLMFPVVIIFLLIFCAEAAENVQEYTIINAVIDEGSRIGKEEKIAMEIAVQSFNNNSKSQTLSLVFQNHGGAPFMVASSAEKRIKEQKVEFIVGMHSWEEATLVADVGNMSGIPVISFAAPSMKPALMALRWPFLISMATDLSPQMKCIADLVSFYDWRRVIVIYENDVYGSDSGTLTLLSDALRPFGVEIEHHLGLPSFSSLPDPKGFIKDELIKLSANQSRVFIVVQLSLDMVIHLFDEAKNIGLVGRESAWILSDSVADLLDTVNNTVIASMEGALGIRNFYSEDSDLYKEFYFKFRQLFRYAYQEEDNHDPGFHALRAYDSMRMIAEAAEKMANNRSTEILWKNIKSSDFHGLSGKIQFKEGRLSHDEPTFRIVNVVGKRYKELDFWTQTRGFWENGIEKQRGTGFAGPVTWPGNLQHSPRGWISPANGRAMKIVVPKKPSFENFVNLRDSNDPSQRYDGFCIEVFEKVRDELGYELKYEFEAMDTEYDELIKLVANKTYDACVGDITILYNRSKVVEFSQPYTESGLSMIVPSMQQESGWLFFKPFTWQMWLATSVVMIYTMFAVWFLEHPFNSAFKGKNQISNTIWFSFLSLFFAQKYEVKNNFTRVVVIMWLFVVFVLVSSYTASLSSMLTVKQLEPAPSIDWLKANKLNVGCDANSFVKKYLEEVLEFSKDNIVTIKDEEEYKDKFNNKEIAAAFLELPYEKVFLSKYCSGYTSSTATYRFGGLAFVFQKGSPLAKDVSQAILKLSEKGELRKLEKEWLNPSGKCSNGATTLESESLKVEGFWGLYVISAATTTIALALFLPSLRRGNPEEGEEIQSDGKSLWRRLRERMRVVKYLFQTEPKIIPSYVAAPGWNYIDTSNTIPARASSALEIEHM